VLLPFVQPGALPGTLHKHLRKTFFAMLRRVVTLRSRSIHSGIHSAPMAWRGNERMPVECNAAALDFSSTQRPS
jgi:hypothetical protein